MFKEVLQRALDKTEGCFGVLIMGTDGIAVEKVWQPNGTKDHLDIAIAEYASLLRNVSRTNREMGFGRLREITFTTESGIFILRYVSEDYFIAMILSVTGNFGRGRYELRRAELLLEKELAV
jgi:predicted regulator of Ras-like GTPase activity (Roadblock/LC7/MglB family)